MASFYRWQSHSFDYEYEVKTGEVMRYIAGTKKGVLAARIEPGLQSRDEAKKEFHLARIKLMNNFKG